jgi:hypothetical protein
VFWVRLPTAEFTGFVKTLEYCMKENSSVPIQIANMTYSDDFLHLTPNLDLAAFWVEEDSWQHQPRRIENLFDCEFAYTDSSTPWLTPATNDPDEFAQILDRAENTNIAEWAFPEAFLWEWEERKAAGRPLPQLGTGSRGPATIMASVLHGDGLERIRSW